MRDALDAVYRAWSSGRAGHAPAMARPPPAPAAAETAAVTFAEAAAEFPRFSEDEREC